MLINTLAKLAKCSVSTALISATLFSASPVHAQVSKSPLFIGGGSVPGNLALVPSVEYPTVISRANLGAYSHTKKYYGYFDSKKCYAYKKENIEKHPLYGDITKEQGAGYFEPVSVSTASNGIASCSTNDHWSGNFLNWAVTPTIDPFRKALTGGYRVVDTETQTILEKAGRGDYDDRYFKFDSNDPLKNIPISNSDNYSPFSKITGISVANNDSSQTGNAANFQKNKTVIFTGTEIGKSTSSSIRVTVRVEVCKPNFLEDNCVKYGNHYKPEGLLQRYSDNVRYSAFSYLNSGILDRHIDGGVLRAQQAFIGPLHSTLTNPNLHDNPQKEWNPTTGLLIENPYNAAEGNSGVINYINKFGELSGGLKFWDNVSELYYTAIRYFTNQGNLSKYTEALSNNLSADQVLNLKDRFPVITDWNDPILYACQKNIILGIGDARTANDHGLPGLGQSQLNYTSTGANSWGGPLTTSYSIPQVASTTDYYSAITDPLIDIASWTSRVFSLETINKQTNNEFTFNNNSAHIAGLAYYANVSDIRPETKRDGTANPNNIPGKQTISTHWIDVIEDGYVYGMKENPYMLATKYGGFRVPQNYNPSATGLTAPAADLWATQNKNIRVNRTFSGGDRSVTAYDQVIPDNYYEASQAEKMVESLEKAFSTIVSEMQLSLNTLSSNSTRLDTDTAVYQATMNSRYWSGDLIARTIDTTTGLPADVKWSAGAKLDSMSDLSRRNIITSRPLTAVNPANSGVKLSTEATPFLWNSLNDAQKAMLLETGEATSVGEDRLNYLRGDRSKERTDAVQNRPFRQRASRLGDIVNSDPQYVGKQNFGYNRIHNVEGLKPAASSYSRFMTQKANRTEAIIFGANDGMLHGVKASVVTNGGGGEELFAFIPGNVFDKLKYLSSPEYLHDYYVDGTPRVADAWSEEWVTGSITDPSATGSDLGWKTIVVGTTGAGGNSVFALDVTNPNSVGTSNFLWEFSHDEMGYTIGQPAVVALPNGKFAVVVTSGYHDSAKTSAKVWFLDVADGSVLGTINIATTGSLGAPLLTDANGDMVAERLYVADTAGNLWAFDLGTNTNGSLTHESRVTTSNTAAPLFTATHTQGTTVTRQPITSPLSAVVDSKGVHTILFGTGSFVWIGDNEVPSNAPRQSFYGIRDEKRAVATSHLLTQTITTHNVTLSGAAVKVRTLSEHAMNTNHRGWRVDLPENGERVVSRATPRGNNVIFTSMTPSNDPCQAGGTSWVMAIDLKTGGNLKQVYFDTNADRALNSGDTIRIGDKDVPISGLQETDGVVKGTTPMLGWLCYVNSSGTLKCIQLGDPVIAQRHSWQEERE